jgi:hypothetical protein
MAKDITVVLEDRPGTLAQLGEALGKAGINIDGICGFPSGGKAETHVLVEDAAGATKALKSANIEVRGDRDVLVVSDIPDKPGALGELCRRIANAGVNINLLYLATNTRVVIGADNIEKAKAAV